MRPPPALEEPYRGRAVPAGSRRYWSWLFAAREARDSLLGIYALMAEWQALLDPGTASDVAQIKLAWWRDEIGRLTAGSPLHPITRYLAELPGAEAAAAAFATLSRAIEAAGLQAAGVPLEHAAALQPHADALYGVPLRTALLGVRLGDRDAVCACTAALGAAEYLVRALDDYRREARAGRIVFGIDELLQAGIGNEDLRAAQPPARLQAYLDELRGRARAHFSLAAAALAPGERPPLRHLLVLAALGARHLRKGQRRLDADFRWADLYKAWNTARRAAAAC